MEIEIDTDTDTEMEMECPICSELVYKSEIELDGWCLDCGIYGYIEIEQDAILRARIRWNCGLVEDKVFISDIERYSFVVENEDKIESFVFNGVPQKTCALTDAEKKHQALYDTCRTRTDYEMDIYL